MGLSYPAPRTTVVALAALIGAAGSCASAATPMDGFRVYKPVADTYVTAARARANFGRSQALRVDASPETTAFVRFRLKRTTAPAASVTLLLRPGSPGTGQVRGAPRRGRRVAGGATDVCDGASSVAAVRFLTPGAAWSLERRRRDVVGRGRR